MKIDISKFIKAIVTAKPENVSEFKFGGGEFGEIQCTFWNPHEPIAKTYSFHVQFQQPIEIEVKLVTSTAKPHYFSIFPDDVVATDYGQSPQAVMKTLRYKLLKLGEEYTNMRISRL